jgi:iron complex outermembrane recepter protein
MAMIPNFTQFVPFLALALLGMAEAQTQLPTVSVEGRSAAAPIALGGFGDTPNAQLPMQVVRVDGERLRDLGSAGLSALSLLDASVSDAYNSVGYISQFKVRGFDLDTRFNLRRDGLPINGETAFDLFNKSAVEVLKGASGLQSGTSSPAGLLNLVVKRPDMTGLDLSAGWEQSGTYTLAVDWGQRAGDVAWRLNAEGTKLDPLLRNSKGSRSALALAANWRINAATLLELELESSSQSQPSQPGFSLLGERLPQARELDLQRNLNDTPWRLPVTFENQFASLRATHALNVDWRLQVHLGGQSARTDDRVAFPLGCAAEGYFDRYCSDGSFDVYDFRSDNERRRTNNLRGTLEGRWGSHRSRLELLVSRFRANFERQAFNYAGTGSVLGQGVSAADPRLTDENTNRNETTREIALSDQWQLGSLDVFAGLRHTQLHRAAVRTDGSRGTQYRQSFTSPWLGATLSLAPQLHAYVSAGQGVESDVTPNRSRYVNAGQALPALKSRQLEIGLKRGSQLVDWSLAAFRITRPVWSDVGACEAANSCARQADGHAKHVGVEGQADIKWQSGGLLASAMLLDAQRQRAQDPALNGQAPVNVPERSIKFAWRQDLASSLQANGQIVHEGTRLVLPDASQHLPSWTRLDLGLRWQFGTVGQLWGWRLSIDNATNRRAWKEAPLSFGHSYLFPLAPRTVRVGVDVAL